MHSFTELPLGGMYGRAEDSGWGCQARATTVKKVSVQHVNAAVYFAMAHFNTACAGPRNHGVLRCEHQNCSRDAFNVGQGHGAGRMYKNIPQGIQSLTKT